MCHRTLLLGLTLDLVLPHCICVKWVPFVKLAFSPGNRAHFGSKMGLLSAFSHYVFNGCGPNRGFHSDLPFPPF